MARQQGGSPFSELVPNLQVAWDSTSLGWLKTCPRKYQLSMIEGWRAKREATPLTFGIHYHSCMEHFHRLRAEGRDWQESVRETLRFALVVGGQYNACLSDGTEHIVEGVDAIQGELHEGVTYRFVPWTTDDSKRNRVVLVQAVAWYLIHFENDPTETHILESGKPAVELSFRLPLQHDTPTGEPNLYCGHLDRVAKFALELWTTDYKTTTGQISPEYFAQYSPDLQMSGYTLASRVIFNIPARGVMIDAIQLGANFARPQRGFTQRSPNQLEEFVHDLAHWTRLAHGFAEANYWPMNDKACHSYGGCVFRGICGIDPSLRDQFLRTHFEVRKWNPLDIR